MNGLTVGLLSRIPSIRVNEGRRLIVQETPIKLYQFSYLVTVEDGQTVSPKFTFLENAPTARVDFGDETPSLPVYSGIEIPHTYHSRGTYTIRLNARSQESYLEQVDITDEPFVVPESWPELLNFRSLTRVHNYWCVGYGEVGIMKIARGGNPIIPAWMIGFGVIGLFSIETETEI